jgi:hypothetical protein
LPKSCHFSNPFHFSKKALEPREEKRREGKGREEKGKFREGKGREEKGKRVKRRKGGLN